MIPDSLSNLGNKKHCLYFFRSAQRLRDCKNRKFILHYGAMTETSNLIRIIQEVQSDEIYNLSAMSHVAMSFEMPEYATDVNAVGTLRLLEAIRISGLTQKTRIYQASTLELFGKVQKFSQIEKAPFYPSPPYAVAKMYAYWIT